jgi:NAD(P)-dependent dehydrogenase (short-subunit alcohol dehydrogenase family)
MRLNEKTVVITGAARGIGRAVAFACARQRADLVLLDVARGYLAAYTTAKHALVGLTKAAALELAPLGVRVNAVCPGSVKDDPALDGRMLGEIARALSLPVADHERVFVTDQPANRLVRAQDVANACVWLASEESADVTGAVIAVYGGFTAR